jgi:PAS domain S-box-containing protein
MTDIHRRSTVGMLTVVGGYAVLAGLWIVLSDQTLKLLFQDADALVKASMFKGWLFVAVTSVLLYGLVQRLAAALGAAHARELALEQARHQPPPMFVAIVETSADAIFAKDMHGRYLLFNQAAARCVGQPAEHVLGQDDRALFPPEQAAYLMAVDQRVRSSGHTETCEETLQTVDGPRIFLATKGPLRGPDGHIVGTYGISRDITERHTAAAELRQRNDDLERFNRAAIDRELRMVALKREVNALALAAGQPAPYDLSLLEAADREGLR